MRALHVEMNLDRPAASNSHGTRDISWAFEPSIPSELIENARDIAASDGQDHDVGEPSVPPYRRQNYLVGDDLVLAQFLVLGEAQTVDPVTRQQKVRQRHAAAAVVQNFVRKIKTRLARRQAIVDRIRQQEASFPKGSTNPALAARIRAMHLRRADLQRRLRGEQLPLESHEKREGSLTLESTSTRIAKASQGKGQEQSKNSSFVPKEQPPQREQQLQQRRGETHLPLHDLENFVAMQEEKQARHQNRGRRHQTTPSKVPRAQDVTQENNDPEVSIGHGSEEQKNDRALGTSSDAPSTLSVGSGSENAATIVDEEPAVKSSGGADTHVLNAEASANDGAANNNANRPPGLQHPTSSVASVNSRALHHAIATSLQTYWRVMAVRRAKELLFWVRDGDGGELRGPATLEQLKRLGRSPAAARIQCRHAGMPAFVPLQFLLTHEQHNFGAKVGHFSQALTNAMQLLAHRVKNKK
eukprot:INCI19234.1.p1 GENE.INCI19234.1~~INCI19234.1.p1  ORF type:complete len:542 (+),score=107.07 INCI19234.1:214-1626(+)